MQRVGCQPRIFEVFLAECSFYDFLSYIYPVTKSNIMLCTYGCDDVHKFLVKREFTEQASKFFDRYGEKPFCELNETRAWFVDNDLSLRTFREMQTECVCMTFGLY